MKTKNPYRTEEFKKLQKEWYKKVESCGFINIENWEKDRRPLIAWHDHRFRRACTLQRTSTQSYYDWAQNLLLSYSFKNKTHRKIWELHCEGKSKRQIAAAIKNYKKSYKREQIGNIIKKIKEAKK